MLTMHEVIAASGQTLLVMKSWFILVLAVTAVSSCKRNIFDSTKRYQSYRSETTMGPHGCAKTCAREGRCRSINYNPVSLTCELVQGSAPETNISLFWSHTANFSFVKNSLGPCGDVIAPQSMVCIPLSNGNYTLVKKYCNAALTSPAIGYLSSKERLVGQVIDVSCLQGYLLFGESSIVCLANGKWSASNPVCRDCGPPPAVQVTSIQPGTNTIGSVRTYMCNGYTAVNYSITCQSNAQWTAPNFMCEWPFGSFSLLQPLAGCPSGFESGSRMWHTEQTSTNEMSPGSNLKGFATGANVEWHFCTRVVFLPSLSSSKNNWPRGNYCVMRFGGICPEGFDEGNIFWDEEDSDVTDRQMNGTMPDGTFDVNSRIHFCCRNDDDPRNPIMLPRTKPFILFRYTLDECQEVFNMTFTKENTQFMDETFNNGDVAFGETPRKDGPPNWRIYYCYYE